jgi:hypothetical protein
MRLLPALRSGSADYAPGSAICANRGKTAFVSSSIRVICGSHAFLITREPTITNEDDQAAAMKELEPQITWIHADKGIRAE